MTDPLAADIPHPAEAHWFQPDLATDPGADRAAVSGRLVVCADVGSAITTAALVDLQLGRILARAQQRSTVTSDPLHGLGAAIGQLPDSADHPMLSVCSSAGGALRLAVVGDDATVADLAAEVAHGAGALVVHTTGRELEKADLDALRLASPDVILLLGGSRHNAERVARAGPRVPVVVAGDPTGRAAVLGLLGSRAVPADGVEGARLAVRDVFVKHVIGDRRAPAFAPVVRAATQDVVLAAVELLGDYHGDDLIVVDVGASTTDVYSVVKHGAERSVEGDLGVRFTADSVVAAAGAEGLLRPGEEERLAVAVKPRLTDPTFQPPGPAEQAIEARLVSLAATLALHRHGRDLHGASLVVLTGGVLRHDDQAVDVTRRALAELSEKATVVVDSAHVLPAAGLIAADHAQAALTLLRGLATA